MEKDGAKETGIPQKENIGDALNKYKEVQEGKEQPKAEVKADTIPTPQTAQTPEDFQNIMQQETDPDLITSYEIIKLPSKGLFYGHKISEVSIEYMTSKDEDLLTTPSLIETGNVLDLLLKRKIKTAGINPEELLSGDRNALILFLRTSSYGHDYHVQVTDPRTGVAFKATVDLTKLKYKELTELPDEMGYFKAEIPMRKKLVKFRLLTSGEDNVLFKKAEAMKDAYAQEFSEYNTLKLKAHIVSIDEKKDRDYIDKFVDAMPALDAFTIRRRIIEVSPDVDMEYEFTAKDEYTFKTELAIGIDFFFPST